MQGSLDLFNLKRLLSTDELAHQERVREFVEGQVIPHLPDWYENQTFPQHLINGFASLGVFGSTIKGFGCLGTNYTTYGLMMQEIERADSGLRSFVSVQGALCMFPISAYGSEKIKSEYLPKMATGELIGCFGLTEPDYGSNPAGMLTKAKKVGDHYVISGHKRWLTNGLIADLIIVWAKDENDKVRGFVVNAKAPGVEIRKVEHRLSLRVSLSSEILFHEVKVDQDHVLNIEGLKGPFSCLNNARFGIAWGVLGSMRDCLERTRSYLGERKQFGDKPLTSHQLIQAKLVEVFTDYTQGLMLALELGRHKDMDSATPEMISMAKMNNVSKALRAARLCRDMMGANGILGDFHVARHMANLESVNTYEGTEDIHRLVLGQYLTGIAAFKA